MMESVLIFLRVINISNKRCRENQNTRFYVHYFIFSENNSVYFFPKIIPFIFFRKSFDLFFSKIFPFIFSENHSVYFFPKLFRLIFPKIIPFIFSENHSVYFFRKSFRLCDNVVKYSRAGQDTDGNMAHEYCRLCT